MERPFELSAIRNAAGLSQADFGSKIGYSREVVNKVESGRMKPSKWFVAAVEKFISMHQAQKSSYDVNFSPGMDRSRRAPFLQQRRQQKAAAMPLMVPLVGIKAQAGYVKGFEQTDYLDTLEMYSLPPGVHPAGATWCYFEVDGESMEPTFSPGDVVLATMVPVEDWREVKDHCVYVILTAEQLLIKRVLKKSADEWLLLSDNEEAAPPVNLSLNTVRQLWLFRRQIRSKAPQPGKPAAV